MLPNAYFLAKIRFDTAENEPAKNLQKLANSESSVSRTGGSASGVPGTPGSGVPPPGSGVPPGSAGAPPSVGGLDLSENVKALDDCVGDCTDAAAFVRDRANFAGLVLGCIQAKFCQ